MDALAGPFLASAALLVAAGATKIIDPLPLLRALRSVGLRAPRWLVRVGAAAEMALGAAAVLLGSRPLATGVALSYAAFTGFVLLGMRRGGVLASCGCFGKDDTPPTVTHVVVTGAAAFIAAAVAVQPIGRVDPTAVALLTASAAVASMAYLVLARLPLLQAARR